MAGLKTAQRRQPLFLGTLAAAHAENGRFEEALDYQRQAIEAAKPLADEKLEMELKKRTQLYKTRTPYREAVAPEPKSGS